MIYCTHTSHRRRGDSSARRTFDDLGVAVREAAKALNPHRLDFDVLVATGMSGACVAFPLALRLRKPVAILRKPSDDCHQARSRFAWIGDAHVQGGRALFVDDFMASGDTYERVREAVTTLGGQNVGTYLYGGDYGDQPPILRWEADDA